MADNTPELTLTLPQIDKIVAVLPRCAKAYSARKAAAKAAFPVRQVAEFVGGRLGQSVYQCGEHFHLTGMQDVVESHLFRARKLQTLIAQTRERAADRDERFLIYGVRTPKGWRYRARLARFRDTAVRKQDSI